MLLHFDKTQVVIKRLFESENDLLNELLTESHCSNEWLKLLFDTSIKHKMYFEMESLNRALKECDNLAADDEKALEWKELISNYIKQIPQANVKRQNLVTDQADVNPIKQRKMNAENDKKDEEEKPTNILLMSIRKNDEKKDEEEQISWQDRFDLFDCYQQLSLDTTELEDGIATDEILIKQFTSEMRPLLQKDFEKETALSNITNRVNLLIQNKVMNVGESDKGAGVFSSDNGALGKNKSPMEGKNKYYGEMLALLRINPHYFTRIIERVKVEDRAIFARTIVFDIYGDLYNEDEERLLLILLRSMLAFHIDNMTNIESILKPDAFITHMLTAFAKRGHALGVQKSTFERPISETLFQKALNLEVNPIKVYEQIIQSYEAKMNKPWDGPRNPTPQEAKENRYVKRLIGPRVKQLEFICEHFIERIIATVDEIPFGSRWICLQIAELAQKKWPSINVYQLGSLVGEYIYLCFVKPVIVDPQSANIVDAPPPANAKRNLKLVCALFCNCLILASSCLNEMLYCTIHVVLIRLLKYWNVYFVLDLNMKYPMIR